MRFQSILMLIALSLALVACTTPTTDTPVEDTTEAPVEDTTEAQSAAEAPDAVGDALSDDLDPTGVAEIAAAPTSFADKKVRVQGVPSSMCGSGCSMTLTDGDAELKIRSNTEVFKFPPTWKDQEVIVEGTIAVDPGCASEHGGEAAEGEAKEEAAHADGEHHAEEPGFVLMATGARLAAEKPAEGEAAEAPAEH